MLHGCETSQACSVICRAATGKGAEEEAERQLVVVKKLKAEVTRKEGMLKATQSELDRVTLAPPSPCRLCLLVLSGEGIPYAGQHSGVSVL